jgi:hypothetical protein
MRRVPISSLFSMLVFTTMLMLGFAQHGFAQEPEGSPPKVFRTTATDSLTASVVLQQAGDSIEASSGILVPFQKEIKAVAREHGLPASLLAAFIQEESAWNPWATREEPGYLRNPIVIRAAKLWSKRHNGMPTALTELNDRSRSIGLMQPMGEVAREQGYDSTYLASLYLPRNSIEQGATLLKRQLRRYGGDTLSAISAYNQGNNRKRHGMFENARYVYRVSLAQRKYHELFTTHTPDLNEAIYDDSTIQTVSPDRYSDSHHLSVIQIRLPSDTQAFRNLAHNSNGSSSGPSGHGSGTRYDHDLPFDHPGNSEPSLDGYFVLGFSTLALGAGIILFRYVAHRSGLDRNLASRSAGFTQRLS